MKTVRVANAGGFWGDWLEAPKRQLLGGKIDYLTVDYLAELTMSLLARQRATHPERGYAYDFVRMCEELLPEIAARNIKVISNAGGMNPLGCAKAVAEAAKKLGLGGKIRIAAVSGDDLIPAMSALRSGGENLAHLETGAAFDAVAAKIQSANAYLSAQPIVDALKQGANIVITGRVSDAALTVAPARYELAWEADDYDALALAVVAGHVLECGAQATGGNCSADWRSLNRLEEIGFPIAEISDDRTAVITKHPGTGGAVSLQSVKEQLLYEIGDPRRYISPDVVADFTSIELKEIGPDRIRISGVKGTPPPETLKVSVSYAAGYRAEATLLYSWPDSVRKAQEADRIVRARLAQLGLQFDEIHTEYIGWNAAHGMKLNIPPDDVPEVLLRIAARGQNKRDLERFTREIPPLVLSGPPGVSGYAGDRPGAQEIFAYWPTLVSRKNVHAKVELI